MVLLLTRGTRMGNLHLHLLASVLVVARPSLNREVHPSVTEDHTIMRVMSEIMPTVDTRLQTFTVRDTFNGPKRPSLMSSSRRNQDDEKRTRNPTITNITIALRLLQSRYLGEPTVHRAIRTRYPYFRNMVQVALGSRTRHGQPSGKSLCQKSAQILQVFGTIH